FLAGGAAISVLARAHDIELRVVDVGVATPPAAEPGAAFAAHAVRPGTRNLRREAAMTRDEAALALGVGHAHAARAADEGVEILGAGEMGIGNTTAAAAVVSALTGKEPELVVGRGTGVDAAGLARKMAVVREALALHALDGRDALGAL